MTGGEQAAMSGSGRKGRGGTAVLVVELAAGTPLAEAARRAGMSERTARRRTGEPTFQAQVRHARDRLLDVHLGRLTTLTAQALDTLEQLLGCQNDPSRLGAARSILEHRLRLEERRDLEVRLTELERLVATRPAPRPSFQ